MKVAIIMPDKMRQRFSNYSRRISPGSPHNWRDMEIVVNPEGGSYDALVVLQSVSDLDREYQLVCPPSKTLLAVLEPPDICFFSSGYLGQFNAVLCHDDRVPRKKRIVGPTGHIWFCDTPRDEIEPTRFHDKPKEISAIVSAKTHTRGHRTRLGLMQSLKAHFGDRLDWWGRGINELGASKIEGLKEYRYHIAIENGSWNGYWTEKLIDCYVANCVPIYWGAPDVSKYFDEDSMIKIDISDHSGSIKTIERAIESDAFSSMQLSLSRQRKRVISKYHRYEIFRSTLSKLGDSRAEILTIRPQKAFAFSVRDRIANRIWKAANSNLLN